MKTTILPAFLVFGLVSVALAADPPAGLDPALLTKPPTDSWPTYHGDYSGRRYSTLSQINTDNVKGLSLAWIYRANTSSQGAVTGAKGRTRRRREVAASASTSSPRRSSSTASCT